MNNVNKVLIAGLPGSGKSTIAGALGKELGLSVIEIDQLCFTSDWKRKPLDEIYKIFDEHTAKDKWIIDGTMGSISEDFITRADLVIYINKSLFSTLFNLIKRKVKKIVKPAQKNYSRKRTFMGGKTLKTTIFRRKDSNKKWKQKAKQQDGSVKIIIIRNTKKKTIEKIVEDIKNN